MLRGPGGYVNKGLVLGSVRFGSVGARWGGFVLVEDVCAVLCCVT